MKFIHSFFSTVESFYVWFFAWTEILAMKSNTIYVCRLIVHYKFDSIKKKVALYECQFVMNFFLLQYHKPQLGLLLSLQKSCLLSSFVLATDKTGKIKQFMDHCDVIAKAKELFHMFATFSLHHSFSFIRFPLIFGICFIVI